jgi:A/G-specific adenine glycosylase
MDYGTHLKRSVGNANVRSKHYKKQSKFEGSDRQIRGAILRELAAGARTNTQLRSSLGFEPARLREQVAKLEAEGLVRKQGSAYRLG